MKIVFSLAIIFIITVSFHVKRFESMCSFKCQEDTLYAEVSYGEDYLLDARIHLSDSVLSKILDSLSGVQGNEIKINQILFFKSLRTREKIIIESAMDSLFRLENIPYGLINDLNLVLLTIEEPEKNYKATVFDFTRDSPFPSDALYEKNWSTHHPFNYPVSLIEKDSALILPLVNPKNNHSFFHPVSEQTIRKYGGKVDSPFGWRDGKNHNGVDIPLDRWDTVHVAFDGKVRFAKNYEGYGKVVIVRHYNGLETLYAHLQKINVKAGQNIKAGQLVGLGGSTGNSTGSHLHFEVRYKGIPINPCNVVDFNSKKLLSDTLLVKKTRNSFAGIPLGVRYHTVERGDYPMKIAQRYGLKLEDFCRMNQLGTRTRLRIGQQLRVSN